MTEKEKLIEKEFKDIDQALHRAAQSAKKLAAQNGTPYVIKKNNSTDTLHQHGVKYNQ